MLGLDNPLHIAFLLVLLLVVFGAKRLPEMGKSLGSGLRGFKDSLTGEDNPAHPPADATPALAAAPQPIAPHHQPADATPALADAPQPIAPHHQEHTPESVGAAGVRTSA